MLTLEERERIAYAEGRVEEAALLREAIDPVAERIDELQHELEMVKAELADLEAELENERERA